MNILQLKLERCNEWQIESGNELKVETKTWDISLRSTQACHAGMVNKWFRLFYVLFGSKKINWQLNKICGIKIGSLEL